MSKKNTTFFALHDDLVSVISMAGGIEDVNFAQGMDDERAPFIYESLSAISRLSEAKYGDQNHEARYLLVPKGAILVPRRVVMSDGRVKNFLHSSDQPSCVRLIPGGIYSKGKCLIAGDVNVITADEWSQSIYKCIRKAIVKSFKKVNGVFVGPQAYEKFKEGYRLNSSVTAPLFTDLIEAPI